MTDQERVRMALASKVAAHEWVKDYDCDGIFNYGTDAIEALAAFDRLMATEPQHEPMTPKRWALFMVWFVGTLAVCFACGAGAAYIGTFGFTWPDAETWVQIGRRLSGER